jgi:predicted O-methyltransferase YrrM
MSLAQSLIKKLAYRCGYTIKKLQVAPNQRADVPSGSALAPDEIKAALHRVDPYEGFEFESLGFDPSGWGSESPAFATLIEEQGDALELIIEVGTWKGGSAIEMARALDEADSSAKIICVDTWLGALEFWRDHDDATRYGALELKNGYPSVYYRFLANVCHAGHTDRVVPFPQTSATAALWFAQHGVKAGLVYVDGSHEEGDVYADLVAYWDLVARGGVMFGDDWAWDGVRMAVERFAREHRLTIRHVEDKWVLARAA